MKKGKLFYLVMAVCMLFASFIFMCGNTHLLSVFRHFYPGSDLLVRYQTAVMVICAVVSFLTAIAGFLMFPVILDTLDTMELNEEGRLQPAEYYLIEAIEMIKEGIVVLSEQMTILKGNVASKLFFGHQCVGTKIINYIHPNDLNLFHETVIRVMGSYNFTPATIEIRIRKEPALATNIPPAPACTPSSMRPRPQPAPVSPNRRRNSNTGRIYCSDESSFPNQPSSPLSGSNSHNSNSYSQRSQRSASMPRSRSSTSSEDEYYLWVEVTLCKGARLSNNSEFVYDVKMAVRNVDDRKKRAQYQSIIEGTEEKGRINESKLRYISCIAHDLKTPLQSFCFSLDLLKQTKLHAEQRDFLEQANVAVDLMKLTISQTMDISKALTGAKLLPRRTTVYLSKVIQRVKVIM